MSARITRFCSDCGEKISGTYCAVAVHFMHHERERRPESSLDEQREFAHKAIAT